MKQRLMKAKDVAKLLQVETATVYTWVHESKIPFLKIGTNLRFDEVEISKWLDSNRVQVAV